MAVKDRAGGDGTGTPGAVGAPRRPKVRLPSAFIALTAGGLVPSFLVTRIAGGGDLVPVVGVAVAGGLGMAACFALAEMRSTAPFSGGTWHFGRMLYGVQGGFLLAWLEVAAMVATAALYARTTGAAAHRVWTLVGEAQTETLATALLLHVLAGLPVTGGLLAWMSFSPATPRQRSFVWRRGLKWVSFLALTVGWGAVFRLVWGLSTQQTTFPATTGDTPSIAHFLAGCVVAFAGLFTVVHSVPGDASAPPPSGDQGTEAFREHRRYRLPRGMILGLLVTVMTASLTGLAALSVPGSEAKGQGTHALHLGVLAIATVLATLGGTLFALARSVRVLASMAREGMLPPWMGRERTDHPQTPWRRFGVSGSLAGVGTLAILSIGRDPLSAAVVAAFLHALLGAVTCFCQVRFRREAGDEVDFGFVLPGFPWLPILGGVGMLGVALVCAVILPVSASVGMAVFGSGLLLHEAYGRTHSLKRPDDDLQELLDEGPQGSDEAADLSRDTLRVLVAAGEKPMAVTLLNTARHLCGKRPTQLSVLHVVTVPDQAKLSEAYRNVSQAADLARTITASFASQGIRVRVSVRCLRSAARGILTTVRESRTDLLLLGWHGRMHRGQPIAWGRTLDPVLRRAPCNIVVAKGLVDGQRYRKILVPVLDPVHSAYALNVASRLADETEDSEIEVFGVQSLRVDDLDAREFLRHHARRVARSSVRITCRTEVVGSVVEGVLEELLRGGFDLVVLGAAPPQQAQVEDEATIPTQIAARAKTPCVMVSVASPWTLWRNRWLRAD